MNTPWQEAVRVRKSTQKVIGYWYFCSLTNNPKKGRSHIDQWEVKKVFELSHFCVEHKKEEDQEN